MKMICATYPTLTPFPPAVPPVFSSGPPHSRLFQRCLDLVAQGRRNGVQWKAASGAMDGLGDLFGGADDGPQLAGFFDESGNSAAAFTPVTRLRAPAGFTGLRNQ